MTRLITLGNALSLLISVAFVSQWAYNYLNKKKKKAAQEEEEINEVLMFSQGTGHLQKSKYSRCVITPSMDRVLHYVNSPRHTLDICMYVLTNLDLAQSVMRQHFRGVKVRVIIDADMAFATGSHVRKLEKQGIPVRWIKSTNIMHHKFTIVDASSDNPGTVPLVLAGSLNWTNQALSGNFEDVIITSQKKIVEHYRLEFERLWVLFKPIID